MAADERRDALVEGLFEATLGTWDLLAVYLGGRLGLYRALADRGAGRRRPVCGLRRRSARGQAEFTRPMFDTLLGSEWLPSIPDVHERLESNPPARVADVACGQGFSSIAIARAYPKVHVDGIDSDEASIAAAERNLKGSGVKDRMLHCLPVGMVGEGAAGTGTVMRAATVRHYADEAGLQGFEVLPIENDFYRFYRLEPGS